MKHTKRRTPRPNSFVVERLEQRRLLSVAPNRQPPEGGRLDAFVQSRGTERDRSFRAHQHNKESKADQNRAEQNRFEQNRSEQRSPNKSRDNENARDRNPNRLRQEKALRPTVATSLQIAPLNIPSVTSNLLSRIDAPASEPTFELLPTLRRAVEVEMSPQGEPPTFGPAFRDILTQQTTIASQLSTNIPVTQPVTNSTSVSTTAAEPTAESQVTALREPDANPAVGATPSSQPHPQNATNELALAAQPLLSLASDNEFIQSLSLDYSAANDIDVYGGEFNFEQMPNLVDTLPAVIDDAIMNLDLEDDEKESEAAEAQIDLLLIDGRNRDEASSSTAEETKTTQEPTTNEESTDVVFTDAEEEETFGGEVEMPAELTRENMALAKSGTSEQNEITFESIVPAAPRIDQIIDTAPLMEIEEQEPTETVELSDPIAINVQASVPTALLCIPALAVRASQRKKKQLEDKDQKKLKELRYSS